MEVSDCKYKEYVNILKEELVPAMGCTEPIAVAYASALARQTLGAMPDRVELIVSGNIIKNVKSVVVPHTGGHRGLKTAVAVGITCGDADKKLEVVADVKDEMLGDMNKFLEENEITITRSEANIPFDLQVRVFKGEETAYVRIVDTHTNVVRVEKNDEVLVDLPFSEEASQAPENRKLLNVVDIVDFARSVKIEDVKEVLDRQIEYNMAIAKEGLRGDYGAGIGKLLMKQNCDLVKTRAKAFAAAGSDARMNGCELPVVINSGSGNQGMTASIPVIIYAKDMNASEEQLYRALVISNLISIHLKTDIGSLSAYCGATSAGVGAGAGICYLYGGDTVHICHTIKNALAINSGMVCDGAKASCAAKIASSLEAAILGCQMSTYAQDFHGGDGILSKSVEDTIKSVSRIAREGMKATDQEIIDIMINN